MSALGAALETMVANFYAHKLGWDDRWEEFSIWAEKGKKYHYELLKCVDEDTGAFKKNMTAFGLPKSNEREKAERKHAIQKATQNVMEEPLKVMQLAQDSLEIMQAMAETGIPNYVSDAGIGALCAHAVVEGAFLNVKINASVCDDKQFVDEILKKAKLLSVSAKKKETAILKIVEEKI